MRRGNFHTADVRPARRDNNYGLTGGRLVDCNVLTRKNPGEKQGARQKRQLPWVHFTKYT